MLDMADKYPPAECYEDDEPTLKVNMAAVLPKVVVDDEECEPTLPSMRNPFTEEKRYPGVGLLICLVTGAAFWGTFLYFLFR